MFFLNIDLKGQSVGVSIKKHIPPQLKTNIKLNQNIDNQYFTKNKKNSPTKIPLAFSVETLPFFCKIEYKMGLNKKLPVKFRLGDVQYVESLEHPKKFTQL
jgi:hypothetical protein